MENPMTEALSQDLPQQEKENPTLTKAPPKRKRGRPPTKIPGSNNPLVLPGASSKKRNICQIQGSQEGKTLLIKNSLYMRRTLQGTQKAQMTKVAPYNNLGTFHKGI
ncbi:unnamed protein product [Arabis nemorensis]|uniref:Uncharacterized protein n=1 Tax=Arabis nemorensis TaxID=586526 RepID=A0A565CEW6_9BRAS|nr:unnamed protein product [Arabis nemorensis]